MDLQPLLGTDGGTLAPQRAIYYPVSDDRGESGLQFYVVDILVGQLKVYFQSMEQQALVGGNQFFYWERGNPASCLAPDVYIIEDEAVPIRTVSAWNVWERGGKVPALAFEVVSDEYEKDYDPRLLARYEALGVRELFRFDPQARFMRRPVKNGPREVLSHFVRTSEGRLEKQPVDLQRGAKSAVYGFYLRPATDDSLRLFLRPGGLFPVDTPEERAAAEAQRAAAEAQRAATEDQRAGVEAERATAAEEEIERLRAELARLRGETL